MSARHRVSTDALHGRLAAVLSVGTLLATLIVVAGIVAGLAVPTAQGDAQPLPEELLAGGPRSIVAVGLLVLTLVPPVLLAVATVGFWRRAEMRYAAVSAIVLALLLLGLGLAIGTAAAGR